MTTFLTKFTVEFPVANGRVFPYLSGGGGVSRVTERASIVVDPIPWADSHPTGFGAGALFLGPTAHSELGLAFVLGGGVDVDGLAWARRRPRHPLVAGPPQL